jgi:RNA polymerase sigma-70 factor (ECF subfamily)
MSNPFLLSKNRGKLCVNNFFNSFVITVGKLSLNINTEFVKIFDETYDSLCHYAVSIINDHDEAKDIVHDAFVYAWNNRSGLDFSQSIKPYLLKVVKNNSLNYIRNKAIREKHHDILLRALDDISIPDFDKHDELIERIKRAIDNLPEQCAKVFKLSVYDGLKYKEIGEKLDISVNTVKTHISKALKTLRTELGENAMLLLLFSSSRKW